MLGGSIKGVWYFMMSENERFVLSSIRTGSGCSQWKFVVFGAASYNCTVRVNEDSKCKLDGIQISNLQLKIIRIQLEL